MTLGNAKLLERCVRGTTQNQNECINSVVWVQCPKHRHHWVKVICCEVASALMHFHGGVARREKVMQRLSLPPGKFSRRASLSRDKKRLRKSDLQASKKERNIIKHSNWGELLQRSYGTQRTLHLNLKPSKLPLLNLQCSFISNFLKLINSLKIRIMTVFGNVFFTSIKV